MPKHYVVEHMEPEMGPWSTLEYIAIATETCAAGSVFHLSSLPASLASNLPSTLTPHLGASFIAATSDVETLSAVPKDRVCLLDPQATETLSPSDAESFDWFVFGGILGDDPPRDRTAELRKYGYPGRNLQKLQMTTDTAVRVTRLVIEGQQKIDEIAYTDFPTLQINRNESTEMPFRYVKDVEGKPVMPHGMVELIKEDANKNLDDLF